MYTSILGYLDAGSGAAVAALVASGSLGVRAIAGSVRRKVLGRRAVTGANPTAEVADVAVEGSGDGTA